MQENLPIAKGEIVLYQPDETIRLEVRLEEETVWLTQAQMTVLFQTTKQNLSLHINNIFKEQELERESTVKKYLTVQAEGERMVQRLVAYYNLDVIISVGYRVKSVQGTRFRQWANQVLKNYITHGYAVHSRIERLEQRVSRTEEKIDFFVQTSLPPVQGIFFNGQVFDAYRFASDLVRKAKTRIALIDNYIDDTVLTLLDKRSAGVQGVVYTRNVSQQLQLDIERHNAQYPPIEVHDFNKAHDRFLLIDDEVYHIGASLKDLGKKWFAFTLMQDLAADELIQKLN